MLSCAHLGQNNMLLVLCLPVKGNVHQSVRNVVHRFLSFISHVCGACTASCQLYVWQNEYQTFSDELQQHRQTAADSCCLHCPPTVNRQRGRTSLWNFPSAVLEWKWSSFRLRNKHSLALTCKHCCRQDTHTETHRNTNLSVHADVCTEQICW